MLHTFILFGMSLDIVTVYLAVTYFLQRFYERWYLIAIAGGDWICPTTASRMSKTLSS